MKKISPLLFIFFVFFLLPAQARVEAIEKSNSAAAVTSKKKSTVKKSSDIKKPLKKQRGGKAPAGKKTIPQASASPLLPPDPLAPSDRAALQNGNIGFQWKGSSNASSYHIQVSSSPTFTPAIIDDTTESVSYDTRIVWESGTYYWRVRAIDALQKSGSWSTVWRFTVRDEYPFTATSITFIGAGITSTNTTSVTLGISATSKNNIAAYYVSENSGAPEANSPGWVSVTPSKSYASSLPYTLSRGDGMKTIFVWFLDAAGRLSTAASNTIILETRAPTVKITDHPDSLSISTTATFSFTVPMAGAKFQCKLDAGSYSTCTSPVRYTGLADEKHTFTVRTVDAAGKINSFPAAYSWGIGLPLENTTPSGFINRGGAYFTDRNPVTLTISASTLQKIKIEGYFASESPAPPKASDTGWVTFPPKEVYYDDVKFTLSDGGGKKTVYVWFKDTEGNVSAVKKDTIYIFNSKHLLIAFLVLQAAFILF